MEEELAPLLIVELLFRAKSMTDLPHVIKLVSLFLDSSVELPLHKACQRGSIDLLERIWDSSDVFSNGTTSNRYWSLRRYICTDHHYRQYQFTLSMMDAVRLKKLEMVEWLTDRFQGYTVGTQSANEASCRCKRTAGRVGMVLLEGAQSYVNVNAGVVVMAAEKGHLNIVQWLIDRNTNSKYPTGGYGHAPGTRTKLTVLGGEASMAIHTAAVNGHLEVAKYLRARAAAPSDSLQRAQVGSEQIRQRVQLFREFGDALDVAVVSGGTMVITASNGHLEVVKWLSAEYGADPDVKLFNYGDILLCQNPKKIAAMNAAATNGHQDVVKYLHELGGSQTSLLNKKVVSKGLRNEREMSGTTNPVQNALSQRWMDQLPNGHLEVVQWLHQHREEGCSTLAVDAAAAHGQLNVVRWLCENRSEGCTTAADDAAENGHLDVVHSAANTLDDNNPDLHEWMFEHSSPL
ncbi:Ankyrin repeat-containing domain [Phytophthora cactorum]|nr:Ankyrin repeat-containing domain [Phytophthora cactorum]